MKYIRLVSRLILGVVFIFSGFVKVIDPLGSAYKFADYFTAFGVGFMEFIALPLAIFLSAFELILGLSLILGYLRKQVFWLTMWFMSFFTVLTLILALFNPVSDCGCFGDALILTNWQTFLKNVVLMLFVLILYFGRKEEQASRSPRGEFFLLILLMLAAGSFSVWNYKHLPLIDFRPYDIGTVIKSEMEVPENAPSDIYETSLFYENRKNGKEQEFSIDNYPSDTASWTFISSESKLIHKGYEPPIHDFAILDGYGNDLVDEILSDENYSLLMISHDLREAKQESLLDAWGWAKLESFANDYRFYAVTATSSSEVDNLNRVLELGYPFYYADEIMLKTIVRSNPGFVLIKDGVILAKWGSDDFRALSELAPDWVELIGNAAAPMEEERLLMMEAGISEDLSFELLEFDSLLPELVIEKETQRHERDVTIIFILLVFSVMLIYTRIVPIKV